MIYEKREFILNNGTPVTLRSPRAADSNAIIEHLRITSGETPFLSRYPQEIKYTNEEEANFIEFAALAPNSIMICAQINGEIIANSSVMPVSLNRKFRCRGEFGISIRKEYCSLGIGSLLLAEIIKKSREMGLWQLELEVCTENMRALALYKKFGFREYGVRPRSMLLDDKSILDEALMLLALV